MMKTALYIAIAVSLLLVGCESKPSLQKFFVDNQEKKDFIALDVSPSILNVDKATLTGEQKSALESFKKIKNISNNTYYIFYHAEKIDYKSNNWFSFFS